MPPDVESRDVEPMRREAELIQLISFTAMQITKDEDWDQLVCRCSCLANTSSFGITRIAANSEIQHRRPFGLPEEERQFDSITDACRQMRTVMYQAGQGTWFSFVLTITRPETVDVDFIYDIYPKQKMKRTSPQLFVWDFDKFPRDEAHTPDWLKAQLVEGRRLLGGGLVQDCRDGRSRFYQSLGETGLIRPSDARAWEQGPEQYVMVMPPDVPYGIVFSDGLSDPPRGDHPGQPEGEGVEMFFASQGFAGGVAPGWLVDVLRDVCRQIVDEDGYGARMDVACPTAPAEWSTNGVVSVGVDVGVPPVPAEFEQPNGHIQLSGLILLRPEEVSLVDPTMGARRAPFLQRLRALPPEQITSLTRPSLV